MLPGFDNWKTDNYMNITEGFTSVQEKEQFTADELDQLNSIISEEDSSEFKDVEPPAKSFPDLTRMKYPSRRDVVLPGVPPRTTHPTLDYKAEDKRKDSKVNIKKEKFKSVKPTLDDKPALDDKPTSDDKPTKLDDKPTSEEENNDPEIKSDKPTVKEGFQGSSSILKHTLKTVIISIIIALTPYLVSSINYIIHKKAPPKIYTLAPITYIIMAVLFIVTYIMLNIACG